MTAWNPRPTYRAPLGRLLAAALALLAAGSLAAGAPTSQQDRLEYPVERTGEFVASLAGSPFVSPVPSAARFEPGEATPAPLRPFTIGRTPGTAGGGYTWEDREVPAQDMYGFLVTETGTADPNKPAIVMITGQHPNESHSVFTLEGTVQVLVDPDDPVGRTLRSRADFYVYPQVNPEGRWARVGRSNPQNPRQDNNRTWSSPGGWSNVEIARGAILHDLQGRDVRYFFDYHAPGHTGSSLFHYATARSARAPWAQLSENGGIRITLAGGGPALAYSWSMMARANGGLDTAYGFTPEIGRQRPDTPEAYQQVGARMALALARALVSEEVTAPPPAGVELRFDFDNGQVPDADGWNVIATPLGGNTYPLIDHRSEVLGARFTVPENLERSARGQWPAGRPLPEWADRAAADGHVSFTEDLRFVIENLGPNRVFNVEALRGRRTEGGHTTQILTLEGVRTDAQGRLTLDFPVDEEAGVGVLNALRVVERPAGAVR